MTELELALVITRLRGKVLERDWSVLGPIRDPLTVGLVMGTLFRDSR